jgi:hypothetical protein
MTKSYPRASPPRWCGGSNPFSKLTSHLIPEAVRVASPGEVGQASAKTAAFSTMRCRTSRIGCSSPGSRSPCSTPSTPLDACFASNEVELHV